MQEFIAMHKSKLEFPLIDEKMVYSSSYATSRTNLECILLWIPLIQSGWCWLFLLMAEMPSQLTCQIVLLNNPDFGLSAHSATRKCDWTSTTLLEGNATPYVESCEDSPLLFDLLTEPCTSKADVTPHTNNESSLLSKTRSWVNLDSRMTIRHNEVIYMQFYIWWDLLPTIEMVETSLDVDYISCYKLAIHTF